MDLPNIRFAMIKTKAITPPVINIDSGFPSNKFESKVLMTIEVVVLEE